MNKLFIIFVIVSLAITVKADAMQDDFDACAKTKCANDSACSTGFTNGFKCLDEKKCREKTEEEKKACAVDCVSTMTATQKTDFTACAAEADKAYSNIISLSTIFIFVSFFLF